MPSKLAASERNKAGSKDLCSVSLRCDAVLHAAAFL